jgi:tetratricopeptide (TPR) repeat protein
LGEALFWAGRLEESRRALERATADPADSPEALKILAAVLEAQGRTEEARAELRRYLQLEPGDLEVRLLLGRQLSDAKRYEEALQVWQGGQAHRPSAELLFQMSQSLARARGDPDAGQSYVVRALEIDPRHLEARLSLGRTLARAGRLEEALRELEQGVRDHPESPAAYFALAPVYQRLGRREDAQTANSRFHALTQEAEQRKQRQARAAISERNAHRLLAEGKLAEAEAELRSVLAEDGDNATALASLAEIALADGETRGTLSVSTVEGWISAGVPPRAIVQALTSNAARSVGVEDKRGAIKPGLAADIVAVPADPLLDARAVQRVLFVMKEGRVHRHDATPARGTLQEPERGGRPSASRGSRVLPEDSW